MMTISNMCTAFTVYSTYFELFFCSWFFVVAQNYIPKRRCQRENQNDFSCSAEKCRHLSSILLFSKEKKFICVPS